MADRIKGITIEIGGNTVKLSNSLKDLNGTIRTTQAELKDVNNLLKLDPGNTELLKQKQDLLKNAISETEQKLKNEQSAMEQLKEAGNTVDNQDQQKALAREIEATKQSLKKLEDQYSDFGSVASQKIKAAGEDMQAFGKKAEEVGGNLSKYVTAPLVAIGGASIAAFNEVDNGEDTIIKKTGAAGEALEDMKGRMNSLATTIPTSFEDAGTAIGEINTRFGLTGDALEDLSKQFLEFSQLNGTDVSSSIDSVQKALAAFGLSADDASEVLDRMNAEGQRTGISMDSLGSSLVSQAPVFKELGLNIDQAVGFMADLEVSGADSSAVMSGLQKAMKNAAKDGKPLNQALSELQNSIENSTDETEALNEAYDLFGKSGAQVYQAVKSGTLDFKKLGETAGDVAGSVSKTFDETIDPIDSWKTTLNQLKIIGAELGGTLGESVGPVLVDIANDAKDLTEKFASLDDNTKELIVKIGLGAAAAGPLISTGGKVIEIGGNILTLVGSLNPAVAGIVGVVGLASTGVALLVDKMTEQDKLTDKEMESVGGLTEKEQELVKTIQDKADAYQQVQESSGKAYEQNLSTVDAEKAKAQDLYDQLSQIVDQNGNVKAGWSNLAEELTGELGAALGIPLQIVDGQVQGYQQLQTEIDNVIEKKKAEAALDAYREEYTDALKNQSQALDDLTSAQQAYNDAQSNLTELQGIMSLGLQNTNQQIEYQGKLYDDVNALLYDYSNGTIKNMYDAQVAEQQLETQTQSAADAVSQASDIYYKGQATIENYGDVTKAVAKGDIKDMQDAVSNLTNHFITAESGNRDSLTRQVADIQTSYEEMLDAWKSGDESISITDLNEKRKLLDQAQAQLDEYTSKHKTAGKNAGDQMMTSEAAAIGNGSMRAEMAADEAARNATDKMASTGKSGANSAGNQTGQGYADGISSKETAASNAGSSVGSAGTSGMNHYNSAYSSGANTSQGFLDGLNSKLWSIQNAAQQIGRTTIGSLNNRLEVKSPSKATFRTGAYTGEGFVNGLLSKQHEVADAANRVALTAMTGISASQQNNTTALQQTAGVGGSTVINMNVYGAQGQDVSQLADVISDRINNAVVRRKAVFA